MTKRRYTVTVRCCLRGTVSEYRITADSKAAVRRFFSSSKDKLLSVECGWGDACSWAYTLLGFRMYPEMNPYCKFKKWREHAEGMTEREAIEP